MVFIIAKKATSTTTISFSGFFLKKLRPKKVENFLVVLQQQHSLYPNPTCAAARCQRSQLISRAKIIRGENKVETWLTLGETREEHVGHRAGVVYNDGSHQRV